MKNVLIRALAFAVEKDSEKFKDGADGVTLSVNGTIISGVLIPRKTFLSLNRNAPLKYFVELAESALTEEEKAENEENLKLEDLSSIYLKNARYLSGNILLPAEGENHISVQIDSIDAYNMGFLG